LYRNSAIDVCVNDSEWSIVSSVKLLGSFVVKDETFLARLIVVLTAFEIRSLKIVVNDGLSSCLKNVKVSKQWYVEEHVAIENNGSWTSHAQSTVNSGSRSVKGGC
jgi:hypothetical protein